MHQFLHYICLGFQINTLMMINLKNAMIQSIIGRYTFLWRNLKHSI